MYIFAKWFISALSVLAAAYLVNGIEVDNFLYALLIALVLGIINAVIRPLLVILTLPVTVLTLGLFILVINGFLFWAVSKMLEGFNVEGLLAGIIGAIVVSVFSWIGNRFLIGEDNKTEIRRHHG